MANIIFAERENARLHPPTVKMRQRLQSAPEKLLKSPMTAKSFNTPLPSGRKAFGTVNKQIATPDVGAQEKKLLLKPQETKVKLATQTKVEEYPEIEKFIPYDPLEFQKYSVPEDLIPLSGFALPGLASFPQVPHLFEDDLGTLDPLPNLSPVKMPKRTDLQAKIHMQPSISSDERLAAVPLSTGHRFKTTSIINYRCH
ncbi:securin isoform X1 [Sparus aurata]|uniref:securin isoform X1 n=1 Tax=Sparus aurata TaxID=8175 RepID=UPI0011C0EE3C|nr:securin-like isoform X1 [Sparus aurata]XP_030252714.1 securin-like isoform X1 [Sparus aurata]